MEPAALDLAPDAPARRRLDRLGLEFLARFLEVELSRHPSNLAALAEIGHVYTRLGRHAEGLAVDRRLAALAPDDPTVHYNLACSLALTGARGAALDSLERAVELGYDDAAFMASDDDLSTVRDDARFQALLACLRGELD